MDLGAFVRVMWRFRWLMVAGLVLASLAAFFSIARIDTSRGTPAITYREHEQWISASTVFVTQKGFPWGRAVLDEMVRVEGESGNPIYVPRYGDPGRYSGLAALYAELAKSDAVHRDAMTGAGRGEYYEPEVVATPNAGALPLLYIKGYGPTPEAAQRISDRATSAFRDFIASEQVRNNIPAEKRVEVVVTQQAIPAELFEARSPARPVFLFLLILMLFVALSFALENMRPRVRPTAEVVQADVPARTRRSA